jgi:ubiquinone/menaquinone biosynthesis C-methylase UbiE
MSQTSATATAPAPSPMKILDTMFAFQRTEALCAAIELGLFTAIGNGTHSVPSIAKACSASERGIRILADYMTIQGLLNKTAEGKYELTPDSQVFLVAGSPAYMGTVAPFLLHDVQRAGFRDLAKAVRMGGTALQGQGTVEDNHEIWVDFAKGMMPMMMPAAQKIAELVGSTSNKVLDIAAGHGLFGIVIAQHNPNAQIYALDWERVLVVASEHAQQFGVANRYHKIAGSAFEVDYGGSDYDTVLLTNFLHHFDQETNIKLLKRVRAALKPGGKAVILEFVPNDDRVTPPPAAGFSIVMLAGTRHGDAYTFREFTSMCEAAGLTNVTEHPVGDSPETIVIAERSA